MSCENCGESKDRSMETGSVAYYRWGKANIGMLGCEQHLKEIFLALNQVQSNREK